MRRLELERLGVLAGAVVIALVGLAVTSLWPATYTASALVRVRQAVASTLGGASLGAGAVRADMVLDQIASADLISREVEELGLNPRRPGAASEADHTASLARMQAAVRAGPTTEPGVWRVTYTARNRALAATVLNDLIGRAADPPPVATASGRDPQLGVLTAARDDTLATVQTLREVQAADGARDALTRDAARRIDLQLRALKPSSAPATASSGGGDLPTLLAERTQLAAAQATLAQRYGPRHPAAIELDRKMQALSARVDDTTRLGDAQARATAAASTFRASLEALRRSADSVLDLDAQQQSRVDGLLQRLTAIGERDQAALDVARRRLDAARLQIRPVALASLPARADASPPRRAGQALIVVAVIVAAADVARRGRRARRFETASDLERELGRPVAAVIPALTGLGAGDRPVDAVVDGGDSAFTAAFRQLRRDLDLEASQGGRIVAVCSALAAEGKTTVAVCLARSVALQGRKVVLVDCDGRRGAASGLFDGTDGPGLLQVLRGEAEPDQVAIADPRSGAHVIRHSAGQAVADLSAEPRLAMLLDQLHERYEVVVLDTAPVLALAEARVVAARADEVLLVARWRRTPVRATRLALALLDKAGAKVRRVALTQAPAS